MLCFSLRRRGFYSIPTRPVTTISISVLLLPSHWHRPEYAAKMDRDIITWKLSWKLSFSLFVPCSTDVITGIIVVLSKDNISIYSKSIVNVKKKLCQLQSSLQWWKCDLSTNTVITLYELIVSTTFCFREGKVNGKNLKDLKCKEGYVDSPIGLTQTKSAKETDANNHTVMSGSLSPHVPLLSS